MSNYTISWGIISYHNMSNHIISFHFISVDSFHTISSQVPNHITSYHYTSLHHPPSFHVISNLSHLNSYPSISMSIAVNVHQQYPTCHPICDAKSLRGIGQSFKFRQPQTAKLFFLQMFNERWRMHQGDCWPVWCVYLLQFLLHVSTKQNMLYTYKGTRFSHPNSWPIVSSNVCDHHQFLL